MCRFSCTVVPFFFQAEDGIRDGYVTGVQTCALPISTVMPSCASRRAAKPARIMDWSSTISTRTWPVVGREESGTGTRYRPGPVARQPVCRTPCPTTVLAGRLPVTVTRGYYDPRPRFAPRGDVP